MQFSEMTKEELLKIQSDLLAKYEGYKAEGLALDMSRGKPSPEQLNMVDEIIASAGKCIYNGQGGDYRNYGILLGIPELRELFADLFGVNSDNVIIGGNSSLTMMFDCVAQGMTHGFGCGPWATCEKRKFLCPSPGYDRHFGVTEYFGFELISIRMTEEGPDMDQVREYCENDDTVKGIWCVPKYSNPTGITFSDKVVKEFAALNPAAKDFRIFWDNAYCVHDLIGEGDNLLNIFDECAKTGKNDMVFEFASTSKITYPGAGVALMIASDNNVEMIKKRMSAQTIGNDKINQIRHYNYLKNTDGIKSIMKKHAQLLQPKFDVVTEQFSKELTGKGIASWSNPNGGYFISLDVMPGCAQRTAQLCAEAGVKLTPAGSAFPYKKDPDDTNIRIAPSFPTVEDLTKAMQILCVSIQLAACEKILSK